MNKVQCMECGKEFTKIPLSHLISHGFMNYNEYRKKYPDAPISGAEVRAKAASKFEKVEKVLGSTIKKDLDNLPPFERDTYYLSDPEVDLIKRCCIMFSQQAANNFLKITAMKDKACDKILRILSDEKGLDGRGISTKDLVALYRVLSQEVADIGSWFSGAQGIAQKDHAAVEAMKQKNILLLGDGEDNAFSGALDKAIDTKLEPQERDKVRKVLAMQIQLAEAKKKQTVKAKASKNES